MPDWEYDRHSTARVINDWDSLPVGVIESPSVFLIGIFHSMIYDNKTEIAHKSVSTYFQCGPFLVSGRFKPLSCTHTGTL